MSSRLRDERGQVIVLAAVMIPVFLLMTALVLDAGNWFTHKRQLQNRADAAALAAGYELAQRWPACVGDPVSESAITDVAKHFGGALENGGVADDPTAVNTEVVDNSKFDIAVNSTSYDPGTDNTDGGGPCFDHAANPAPEGESNISPAGGTWVDVKVRENDTKSFAGAFGVNLLQNRARARVELLESSQGDQFVPLAVPEEEVAKARIRFINDCSGSVLQSVALKPLQSAYQTASGMQLWGPDPSGTATSVAPGTVALTTPTSVPVPSQSPVCNGNSERDYTPIRVELRIAGRPDIDISDTVACSTLQTTTSADCYPNISQIRTYQPDAGLFGDRPQIRNVTLSPSGSNPCVTDPYYTRPATPTACTFDASVFMDWGSRPTANATFTATIQVGGGPTRTLTGPTPQGTWTASQVSLGALGQGNVRVHWTYELTSGSWSPGGLTGCNNRGNNPCKQNGNTTVHQVNLGDDPSGNADPPSDVVGAVKLTSGPSITSSEVHSAEINTTVSPYVTIGLHSALQPGDWTVLRLRSGQRNFSVICDPYWDQPSSVDSMAAFYYGCQAPYGSNDTSTTHFWWNNTTKTCPPTSSWFSYSGTPPNVDYPHSPWQCVQLDVGGNGFTVGDGIALATGNCRNTNVDPIGPGSHATCQGHNYQCNNGITYHGGPDYPTLDNPRVIKLFVVPWGAYKNVSSGNGQIVPVLRLAAFYVTAWHFNNGNDPCPGNENARLGGEQVGGYFIKAVESSGPSNPQEQCSPDDVNLCTVALVR
jgi:putative Flp pilus-assembly TadE/G-like protein